MAVAADETEAIGVEIAALRRELKLTWDSHEREHKQHEIAHAREHQFAQTAIETAATLAKENKADANEWRGSMNDRERRFATKDDVQTILGRLDAIERANLVANEQDRARITQDAEARRTLEERSRRGQWVIGLVVGLMATFGAILVNFALRP